MANLPTVIFVNGLPASGKTTLSRALAGALRLPLFSKDQFKEVLFDTLGWGERAWSRTLGVASISVLFSALESQLAAGCSCIAESNFHPELDTARVRALGERCAARWIQILCVADGAVLQERFRARAQGGSRHPGHLDALLETELAGSLAAGRVAPMAIGGTLIEVDTSGSGADIERLAVRVGALVGGQPEA